MNLLVQSQSQVLGSYSKKIASIYKHQQLASQTTIKAIIEIGNLLIEAREYKDSLNQKNKNELWKKFSTSLSFSSSSISKYIKIAEHPILRLKKNHKFLPPSIHSLYEISQINEKKLLRLISTGKITSEIGRSELLLLQNGTRKSKSSTKSNNEVEVLSIRFPIDSWVNDFHDIQDELLRFLENKKISFAYGNEFKKLEKAENSYQDKVTKKSLQILKRNMKKYIFDYVNNQGLKKNYWTKVSQPSWITKFKKIGFNRDEVDVTLCSNESELRSMYLSIGLGDENTFLKMQSESLSEAISAVPYPKILKNINESTSAKTKPNPSTFKKRGLNFTGVKV
jgi:hypothetical protein